MPLIITAFHRMCRWLRPLRWRLRGRHRPAPRNVRHHPVLAYFPCWNGTADGRFCHDFLGIRTDPQFRSFFRPDPPGPLQTTYPIPTKDYFELTFALEAVLTASAPRFTMVELGAGYGPWSVVASVALRRNAEVEARLIAVEMEASRCEWMHAHFRNNGLDPACHRLLHAAVSDHDDHAVDVAVPGVANDYRLSLARVLAGRSIRDEKVEGAVRVPCVSLPTLLAEVPHVDLMHMDLQRDKAAVVPHALDVLTEKVYRLVAMHSSRIHRRLRASLRKAGWHISFDAGFRRWKETPFGTVYFLDGLLTCRNPRLTPTRFTPN